MPYEKPYGDKRRNDCHGKIECDVLQFVTQSLDIHKKVLQKLCFGELE